MDIHTLYIIAYATSTTSSLGSCAILLFLNYGNIETNPVYLKARRILAFATFLVAIGGLNQSNILELSGTGVDGVALVSAIFSAEDIESECRELRALSEKMVNA